jgi:hypothetical protein
MHFVDHHQILERTWCKEERVALLQRHGRTEFGLVVVVTEMSDLVQVAGKESKI